MIQTVLTASIFLLFTVSRAEPPVPQYGVPFSSNPPINNYGTPNYNINNDQQQQQQSHDHSEPKSYEFGYQVKDDYTGNNYGRQERSDGNQVTGEYRVQLPDGRTQVVTYYADWQTGYHADVRYEGPNPGQYPNNNVYNNPGSPQYGPPVGPGPIGGQRLSVGQYQNNQNYDYTPTARSSVAIKGLSGGGSPYSVSGNQGYNQDYNNGVNDGINFGGGNYDNFGSRIRPGASPVYGAPY